MGRLDIRICAARNLPDTQMVGKPDPYVIVKLENQTHRTSVCDNQTSPTWNEVFKFTIADENSSQIRFELWNKNVVSDEFLGCYHLSVAGLFKGVVKDEWYLLQQCKTNAELHIRMLAHDFGIDPPQGQANPGHTMEAPHNAVPVQQYQQPPQQQYQQPPPQQYQQPPQQQYGQGFAPGQPQPGAVYHLVPRNAPGKVLGCAGGNPNNGTQVVLWDRDGSPNQAWRCEDRGNGFFSFVPQHAQGQKLDSTGQNGQPIHIWDCANQMNPNQMWRLEPTDSEHFLVLCQNNNGALDVANFRTDNGATLHTWADHTRAPNQQWRFERCGY